MKEIQPRDISMDDVEALETQALLQAPQTAARSEPFWPLAVAAAMLVDASFLLALGCRKLHFALL